MPLSADGVVVLGLTRMARSPKILELLQSTALMAHCRERVAEAGCSIQPPWAGGAKTLVPLTEEHLAEAETELSYNHIVSLYSFFVLATFDYYNTLTHGRSQAYYLPATTHRFVGTSGAYIHTLSKPTYE